MKTARRRAAALRDGEDGARHEEVNDCVRAYCRIAVVHRGEKESVDDYGDDYGDEADSGKAVPNGAKLKSCCHLNRNLNLMVENGLGLRLGLRLGSEASLNLAPFRPVPCGATISCSICWRHACLFLSTFSSRTPSDVSISRSSMSMRFRVMQTKCACWHFASGVVVHRPTSRTNRLRKWWVAWMVVCQIIQLVCNPVHLLPRRGVQKLHTDYGDGLKKENDDVCARCGRDNDSKAVLCLSGSKED